MDQVLSPITGGETELLKKTPSSDVIGYYRDRHGVDVGRLFADQPEIRLFKCTDTGYEFFHPLTLAGDGPFYSDLYSRKAAADWAYKSDKWDYRFIRELIAETGGVSRVLDIGAGDGSFLRSLELDDGAAIGLEMSAYASESSAAKGFSLISKSIEDFAPDHQTSFDLVTAIQVLEHVGEVRSFLDNARACLRPGGRLVIIVPNNDSFLGDVEDLELNMPPHHVGRWRRVSLAAIARTFDLTLERIELEPLQPENTRWYQSVMEKRFLGPSRLRRSLYYRLGFSGFFDRYVRAQRHTIAGHSIAAVYRVPVLG